MPIAVCAAAGDLEAAETRRSLTRDMWRGRLRGVQRNVEVWQALLSVRSLVLPMQVGRVSAGFQVCNVLVGFQVSDILFGILHLSLSCSRPKR